MKVKTIDAREHNEYESRMFTKILAEKIESFCQTVDTKSIQIFGENKSLIAIILYEDKLVESSVKP